MRANIYDSIVNKKNYRKERETMLRLVYVILISLPWVLFYMVKSHYVMNHMQNYSETYRYTMVRRMITIMKRNGRIKTDVYGKENLPKEGGYVMYSNHQGKYDVLGIISAHDAPCSFVIDDKRAELPIANEVTALLEGCRLDKSDLRKQMKSILDVVAQVKQGRRFVIFPEGGYDQNKNELQDFMPGSFKCSMKSKTPIIPVAIKDSYKVFGVNSLKKVKTEVHFLPPIYYEDYGKMSTVQIAEMVKNQIDLVINGKEARIA